MIVYVFERFVRGQQMAEGARVTRATNAIDALQIAEKLFSSDPEEMRHTTFKLVKCFESDA